MNGSLCNFLESIFLSINSIAMDNHTQFKCFQNDDLDCVRGKSSRIESVKWITTVEIKEERKGGIPVDHLQLPVHSSSSQFPFYYFSFVYSQIRI